MKLFLRFIIVAPIFCFSQTYSISLPQKNIYHPEVLDSVVDKWDKSFVEYKSLNPQAKELLYWTNYSRRRPHRFWDSVIVPALKTFPELSGTSSKTLYSDLSKLSALPLFEINSELITMSQGHSDEIGKQKLPLTHDSPDGSTFGDRFKKYGLKNCGGENISLSDDALLGLILLYIDYNLISAGHRRNLLSTQFTQIGIGATRYGNTENILLIRILPANNSFT